MNPLVETWKRGWYRLINRRYNPPYVAPFSQEVFRHVFYLFQNTYYQVYQHNWGNYYQNVHYKMIKIIQFMLTHNRLPKELGYRHFTKPKKDGTERLLTEPSPLLKAIQHDILKNRLNTAQIHSSAIGFRKGKSIADHVWAHAGAAVIITADIEDFFPNTDKNRVYDFWRGVYDDEDVARLLTLLTTYKGGLPQGAPTSPMLSNAVNYEMDKQIAKKIALSGGKYTRYGDDMVFSWHHRPPSDFERAVKSIIRSMGYDLHPRKGWQVYHRRDEPEITGVILTKQGSVEIPDWVKSRIAELRRSKGDSDRLAGYLGYQKMVETRR